MSELRVGDRLAGHPCRVEVREITGSIAWVWCDYCRAGHAVDRPLFESGRGPWSRVSGENEAFS